MNAVRSLNIPVILGTTRKERATAHPARLMVELLNRRAGVRSHLIDIAALPITIDDAGEAIKPPAFAEAVAQADALVIATPEYNHSFPGLLKHVLDSCLSEYVHKAVGIVGVSAGPFSGTRVIQNLLPVMREVGLVTIFWDINVGQVSRTFAEDGRLLDEAFVRRSDKFIRELIWMAKVLRHGRESVRIDEEAADVTPAMPCPNCGAPMTHHADKLVTAAMTTADMAVIAAVQACGQCGQTAHKLDTVPAAVMI